MWLKKFFLLFRKRTEEKNSHLHTGKKGEILAAKVLKEKGYNIIAHNERTPYGEIDLIGKRGKFYYLVEVKTFSKSRTELPVVKIDSKKIRKLKQNAFFWAKNNNIDIRNVKIIGMSVILENKKVIIHELIK